MYDVAIVGGSFAGLAAALQLARASRSVLVIDAGQPRNRTSPAAHGVPGWDGVPPADILAAFRRDLSAYPTVHFDRGRVSDVHGTADAFHLDTGAARFDARRVLLAHGVQDILPDIPGLAEAWGRTLLHCPYCHGYEVKGRPLAVLAIGPMAAHQAQMLRADWSDDVTLVVNGVDGIDCGALEAAGITVDDRAPIAAQAGDGLSLVFSDGPTLDVAAAFTAPRISLAGTPADQLSLDLSFSPIGAFVRTGPMQQTSVAGVFAAGDLATPAPNVSVAVGSGSMAGSGCHQSLLFPDFVQPLAPEAA